MRLSIRYQLLVPLLTLLLGVVGMSVWTALASAARVRAQIETQIHDIADTVNAVTFPRNRQTLRLMKGLSGAEFVLGDNRGRPLEDSQGEPMTTLKALPGQLPPPTEDWESLPQSPRVQIGGETYFCRGVPLGRAQQPAILYVLYPEALWRDALWQAIRPSLIFGVLTGLASVVLTVVVALRLTRRIQDLERRTRLIAGGDFSPMPLPRRHDELRDLSKSVNEMAQRLAQFQETVKNTERLRLLGQVGGGLAHQLRNGVTGARLAVQLHARECNGQADAETLQVALRQLDLVELHLKRFLDLGRTSDLPRQPCSLNAVLTETVTLLRPQCRHAHIDLRWQPLEGGSEPTVVGDASQLSHLFLNVLSNAVEAAGPRGQVEVRLQIAQGTPEARGLASGLGGTEEQSAIIEISDSGAGPAPEVAERLFEPFVTGKRDGVGLGLAVARQVAQAHGGTIGWRREPGRTCFVIGLPLA
jgi:signal transduction histidine kinase